MLGVVLSGALSSGAVYAAAATRLLCAHRHRARLAGHPREEALVGDCPQILVGQLLGGALRSFGRAMVHHIDQVLGILSGFTWSSP